jgi:hypothetical protein
MRVRFATVEEFLEELGLVVAAPPAAMTPPILRLTCTYTRAVCHGPCLGHTQGDL